MENRILKNLSIIFSAICLLCSAAPDTKVNKRHLVYSHGFGELGNSVRSWVAIGDSHSAPTYPDAPGKMTRASLYTKEAVLTLSNHLHDKVIGQGFESIILVGFSCGAGTMFNCLEKLINYDADYFKDTNITATDADKIIAAINNGAVISTAPLLALRKGNIVIVPATIFSGLTVIAATALTYYHYAASCFRNKAAILLGGALLYWTLDNVIKQAYIYSMVNWMAPRITHYNFDPKHADPLQSIEKLHAKLTCPILLHFHAKDGIVAPPDHDTINVYKALKNDKTHIIITDDSWHNGFSEQFLQILEQFYAKYLSGNDAIDMSTTQPDVTALKKQIYR